MVDWWGLTHPGKRTPNPPYSGGEGLTRHPGSFRRGGAQLFDSGKIPAGEAKDPDTVSHRERGTACPAPGADSSVSYKASCSWGAWGAQVVERPTPDLSSGSDLSVVRWSPRLGSTWSMESTRDSLLVFLPLPHTPPHPTPSYTCAHTLSLSKKNSKSE